jgi:alpha-beta hydrolase superfamily lysophospholipase
LESQFSIDGLHIRRWPAPHNVQARGTVQIVHGLGEHIGRYDALARRLNAAGWHVGGHDHRGHGLSEGARGCVQHSNTLLTDIGAAMDHLRGRGPLVLLGHSMGGAIAARFVAEGLTRLPARWSRDVNGLVLSSPALRLRLGAARRLLLALLPRWVPNLALRNGLDPAWISRDPAVVQAYRRDVHNHDRLSPRLARCIVDAGAQALRAAPFWNVPTLLMWGEADRCVDPGGSAAFAAAAPAGCVEAVPWPGLAHEIFNEPEPEGQQVFTRLLQWLQRF